MKYFKTNFLQLVLLISLLGLSSCSLDAGATIALSQKYPPY